MVTTSVQQRKLGSIEDECNFLFEMEKNKTLRKEFYRKITSMKENFEKLYNSEKIRLSLVYLKQKKRQYVSFPNLSMSLLNARIKYMIYQQCHEANHKAHV